MTAWMRWARGLACSALRRPRTSTTARARARYRVGASIDLEGLERREVLSASGLASFATLPVHITTPTSPTRTTFQFPAGEITSESGTPVYLGFNAQPAAGSSDAPQITNVTGPAGGTRTRAPETGNAVFITKVGIPVGKPSAFAVDILSMNNRTGDATVSAFLPGDVNGDGVVDARDITLIRSAYGSHVGQARYNPAADFNGDGKVGCVDMSYAKKNLGVRITLPTPPPAPAVVTPPTPAPVPVPAPQPVQVAFAPAPVPVQTVTLAPAPVQTVALAPVQTVSLAPVQTVAVAQVQSAPVTQLQYAPAASQTYVLAPSGTQQSAVPFNGQVIYGALPTQAVASNSVYTQGSTVVPVSTQGTVAGPVYYQLAPYSGAGQVAATQGQTYYTLAPAQGAAATNGQVLTYSPSR